MARIRTLAGGIAAWVALSSQAGAAPMSWFDSQANLTAWYANQLNSAGNIYSSPTSANTIKNLASNWYGEPTPTAFSAPIVPAAAPVVAAAPAPVVQQVVTSSTTSAAQATPVASVPKVDAFINMGSQPYAEASLLAAGNPQPWYKSPSATAAFGGAPNATQQAQFTQDVLSKVDKTFTLSGLNDITLTTDPNVPAAHMMSVVSGASYSGNANAIGITDVGNNGFSFIDKLNYASNEDQLSWAVAHNVAHELMHAFGVGEHPDQTGDYVDAGTANWNLLTDPNATFSPAAVSLLKNVDPSTVSPGLIGAEELHIEGDQVLAAPVPEPSTIAVWIAAGLGGALTLRRRTVRPAA